MIFRENTEDIYAGIEFAAGTPEAQKVLDFLRKEFPQAFEKIRFGTKEKAAEFWKKVGAPEKDDVMRRHRNQTGQPLRQRSPDSQRDLLRDREPAQERDAGAQGQHHEIHRRRVPRLGLRDRETIFRRGGNRWRAVVQDSHGQTGRRHCDQGRHRRHHAAAGAHATGGFRRDRHA